MQEGYRMHVEGSMAVNYYAGSSGAPVSGQEFKEAFMQGQNAKREARLEEMKQIQKSIYQMQVMIDNQQMETFKEECEKSEAEKAGTHSDAESADKTQGNETHKNGKTDSKTEMERMMSYARSLGLG